MVDYSSPASFDNNLKKALSKIIRNNWAYLNFSNQRRNWASKLEMRAVFYSRNILSRKDFWSDQSDYL